MTTDRHQLSAQARTIAGKKVKKLRQTGVIPANVFGDVDASIMISVDLKNFRKVYEQAGETGLVDLTLESEKKPRPVLIDQIDIDPISQTINHVSFRQVNLREPVEAEIPVELVGELEINDAVPVLVREVIEVKALPADLPESFEIDISQFTEIGQEVLANQLKFDRNKVELLIEDDQVILQVQQEEQMAEEEPETPTTEIEGEDAQAATEGDKEDVSPEKSN